MKTRVLISLIVFTLPLQGVYSLTHARSSDQVHLSIEDPSISPVDVTDLRYQLEEIIHYKNLDLTVIVVRNPELALNTLTNKALRSKYLLHRPGFEEVLIVIELASQQSSITYWSNQKSIHEQLLTEINYQFVQENLKGDHALSLFETIHTTTKEIIKIYDKDRDQPLPVDDGPQYSDRFSAIIIFMMIIALSYIVIKIIKHRQEGKPYETKLMSTFGRISKKHHQVYQAFVAIIFIIILFKELFFWDEVFIASFIVIAVRKPITHYLLYLGFLVKDFVKIKKLFDTTSQSTSLPVVAARVLTQPDVSNVELLQLTYHSLVIKKQLLMQFEWKEFRDGRSRRYVRIEKGPAFDLNKATSYERYFLEPIKDLEMEYGYYLPHYIAMVSKNLKGLKSFKRNDVSSILLKHGFIDPGKWLLNMYVPSEKGKRELEKLKEKEQLIDDQLRKHPVDTELLKEILLKNQDNLLLDRDLQDKFYHFLPAMAIQELKALNHPIVQYYFDDEFDLKEFETTFDNYNKEKIYIEDDEY